MIDFLIKHDWLGHIVEAVVMAAILTVVLYLLFGGTAVLMGCAFAIGHFHGREKRDYEVSVHMQPPHLDAYKMWKWSFDQQTDFCPVALVMAAIIAGVWLHG